MINEAIKFDKVRLITDNTNEIMDTKIALEKAKEIGLDLICINTNSDIPVCKIDNYEKMIYSQKKKQKENQKKSKKIDMKEIKLSESTEVNDLKTKAKLIDKFLAKGHKIKITIVYRGRNIIRINNGIQQMNDFLALITNTYSFDTKAKIIGNTIIAIIKP